MKTINTILVDVDGTLMTDEGIIPSEINGVFDALISRGVKIIVASGRQINNLFDLFYPYSDDLYFIAQNGAVIAQGKEILYEKRMKKRTVEECVNIARNHGVYSMLYTNDIVLVENNDSCFLSFLKQHQVDYNLTEDLNQFAGKTYKLSFFKMDGGMSVLRNGISINGVNVFLVNDLMIDITNADTDKGKAVKRLKKLLGVRKKEMIAFGDSENDLAMFTEVGKSYAVDNAPKEVKGKASCIIPSNNDFGVMMTLKQLFDLN